MSSMQRFAISLVLIPTGLLAGLQTLMHQRSKGECRYRRGAGIAKQFRMHSGLNTLSGSTA